MVTRRSFLASTITGAALATPTLAALHPRAIDIARELKKDRTQPQDAAANEHFWGQVARAFTIDRAIINLNNGGVSPSPAFVQEAMKRHLDFSNTMPPPYALWQILEPQKEGTRRALAHHFGGDPEELAITRNASESLQILQFGLPLNAGDEVLTTTSDYPRMINTFLQREQREKIKIVRFQLPQAAGGDGITPPRTPGPFNEGVVRAFESRITPRTRMILCSHMVFLNGGVLPVKEITALGRARGIPVIVDAAHSFAHLDYRLDDLDVDYLGVSLHKWLFAPHGTGLLYVRRGKISSVWPLMAATEAQSADIRKFEEIGTHPAANHLAIAEALTFHDGIGGARKLARLIFLRDRWVNRVVQSRHGSRARLHTPVVPGMAGGIATVDLDGLDPAALREWLWARRQIFTTSIDDAPETPDHLRHNIRGLRISPSVYTTTAEIDRFADALEHALEHGLT